MDREQTANSDDEIDLLALFKTFRKHALVMLLFTLVCTALTALYAYSLPPIYRAEAKLLIEDVRQQKLASINEILNAGGVAPRSEYFETQLELIKSNAIAYRVIDQLNLISHPEFAPPTEPSRREQMKQFIFDLPLIRPFVAPSAEAVMSAEINRQNVLNDFKRRLNVAIVKKTQLVTISFEAGDAHLAALIANTIGQVYIDSVLADRLLVTEKTSGWMTGRLASLRSQLSESEANLTHFLQTEGLIDLSGIDNFVSTQLEGLTKKYSAVRERRLAAQSLFQLMQESPNRTDLYTVSEVANHPQMRDIYLAETEAAKQVDELSKRYGPKHDEMQRAVAELESIKARGNKKLNQLYSGIRQELEVTKHQEAGLLKALKEKQKDYQELALKRSKYDSLKREVETNRQLLNLFFTRQKETQAATGYEQGNARFSDTALVPLSPVKPKKSLIVVLGGLLSFIFISLLVLLKEFTRNTLQHAQDVEQKLGLHLLGSVPKIVDKSFSAKDLDVTVFNDDRFRVFGESIRSIRTSLMLSMGYENKKCIALTSSIPGEGKTTTALNLSISLAQMEKVLLIDCDLRKPVIAERVGFAKSHPGVTDVLLMGANVDDCIYHDDKTGLNVLTSGLIPMNPQELLSSPGFKTMLNKLAGEYDKVIIDTPPVLAVSDALIVGSLTKHMIVVAKANYTNINKINRLVSELVKHQIIIDGLILNQINEKKSQSYDYYGSYEYRDNTAT